jgi:ubiquinone/menaquinone biosynthesis C-methylase UbiE
MSTVFDEQAAAGYESWYETPEGARADALEKEALQRVLMGFSGVQTIIEVGCGTGHFTRWLADLGWTAVGLDLSAVMLAEARVLNDVPLTQGDAGRLPFSDGAFDVTTLITTLEFLEQPEAALVEAARVARRGLVLGVLNRCSILALRRRLSGLFHPTIYDSARFYSVSALKQLGRAAVGDVDRVEWLTTLFPGWTRRSGARPRPMARAPWGGFIVIGLHQTP